MALLRSLSTILPALLTILALAAPDGHAADTSSSGEAIQTAIQPTSFAQTSTAAAAEHETELTRSGALEDQEWSVLMDGSAASVVERDGTDREGEGGDCTNSPPRRV